MTSQTEVSLRNYHRAFRFFWVLLIGASTVSVTGNIAHAALPYVPRIIVRTLGIDRSSRP